MANLIIRRRFERFNLFPSFHIILDGTVAGKIAPGCELAFATTEGKHTLQAKLGWVKTAAFTVDVTQPRIVYFQSKGVFNKYNRIICILNTIGLLALLSPLKHIIAVPLIGFEVSIMSAALVLLVYYLAKGIKKDLAFFAE